MLKILSTYILLKKYIKCNIWRVAVRPSYIWDARFLKVKFEVVRENGKFRMIHNKADEHIQKRITHMTE
jgi:hypothetical protein